MHAVRTEHKPQVLHSCSSAVSDAPNFRIAMATGDTGQIGPRPGMAIVSFAQGAAEITLRTVSVVSPGITSVCVHAQRVQYIYLKLIRNLQDL